MEKQRDKAAKRLQRKLQRESGIPLPDDGDGLDLEPGEGEIGEGEPGKGEPGKGEPGEGVAEAGELVKATDTPSGNVG